jgi:hypothetical protein
MLACKILPKGYFMADTPKTALDLLQQLRTERDELNVLISGLEKRLGVVSSSTDKEGTQAVTPKVTVSIDNIPVGFFHNMSQAGAAEKLLKMNSGHPLTSNEIMDAFRKAGMEVTSKNALTILYTAMKRSPKFERVAGKAWGLAEWYPEKRKRKDAHDEEASEDAG